MIDSNRVLFNSRTVTLGELSSLIQYGLNASAEQEGKGFLYLRISDINDDGVVDIEKPKYLSTKTQNVDKYVLEPGDVVIARSGSVGRSFVYKHSSEPWVFASYLIRFRIRRDLADPNYIGLFMRSSSYRKYIDKMSRSVAQANINSKELSKLPIPLPPLPEQRKIIAILQEADELRSLRQQANEKAKQFLPSLFKEMFGTEIAKKNSWSTKLVAELGAVQYGLTVNRTRRENKTQYPYLRVANVFRGKLNLSEVSTIGVMKGDLQKYALQAGDVLVVEGHANPKELGRAAAWNNEIPDCLHQNHLLRIRPISELVTPNYLANCINSADGLNYMLRYGKTSSGLNTINSKILSNMPITHAPLEVQQEFERCYIEFQELLAQGQQSTKYFDDLFESLLAQAFTGELTTTWREQHQAELAEAAAERDCLLQISQPVDVEELISEETIAVQIAELHRDRAELLNNLSKEQRRIYELVIQETNYFTPEGLEEKYSLPRNQIQGSLQLFAATGLILPLTLPTATTKGLRYELAYRNLNPDDDTRLSDEVLEGDRELEKEQV